jgi:multimeric flavodoxin WrbA
VKVVAFNGSPRVKGNTELLLNEALKPLQESGHAIRLFHLNSLSIKPCQDCGGCAKTGVCIYNDDMREISLAIREADRIILASPIFFFGLSAQAKAMIDRCQTFWCEKYLLKKPISEAPRDRKGLLLLVGGMKKVSDMDCAEVTAKAFFRTVSVPAHETLRFAGVDAKGDILKHPAAMSDASAAGKQLGNK